MLLELLQLAGSDPDQADPLGPDPLLEESLPWTKTPAYPGSTFTAVGLMHNVFGMQWGYAKKLHEVGK